jgi:GTPase SAR1 family protein
MTQSYYRDADCCVCVFDKTNRQSLDDVEKWSQELDRYTREGTPRILVGTKKDSAKSVVNTQDAELLRRKLKFASYYEVSAKEGGADIHKVFTEWLSLKN